MNLDLKEKKSLIFWYELERKFECEENVAFVCLVLFGGWGIEFIEREF